METVIFQITVGALVVLGVYQEIRYWILRKAATILTEEAQKEIALLNFYRTKFGRIERGEFEEFLKTGEIPKSKNPILPPPNE